MATKIYVVFGQTGEYSSHERWPVAAYFTREKADRHADAAMMWARANSEAFKQKAFTAKPLNNPHDAYMQMERDTDYSVDEVDLAEEPPTR